MSPLRHRALAAGLGFAVLVAATLPGAAASGAAPRVIDEASINRAKTGISLFLIDNVSDLATGVTAPCPMMTPDEFGWFMGQQGFTPNLGGWAVDLFSYDDVGDGAIGVSCGIDVSAHLDQVGSGAPHGGHFEAMILPANATFSDALAVIERAAPIGPGAPDIGGEIGGTCYTGDLAACIMLWHRSGLVINFVLGGPAAEVTQERTVALLTSMVPTFVEGLAAYADSPATGASSTIAAPTTVTVAPTAAPPATAAPATAAPATAPVITAPATPTTLAVPVPPVTNPVTAPPTTASPVTSPVATVPPLTTAPAPLPPSSVPPLPPTTVATGTTVPVVPGTLDLAAARAALGQFIAANPVGTDVVSGPGAAVECPGLGMDGIGQALTGVGLVPNLAGFRVQVVESGIAPGLATVACGGDVIQALVDSMDATTTSHTPLLTMYDITGVATIDQVLAERPGLTLLQSNVPSIGGEIYGGLCEEAVSGATFCVRIWHREGFVVMVEIAGTAQAGFEAAATQLITTLVPEVVNELAVPS